MSDASDPFGFGKFIPGFEFLQSLAQGAAADAPLSATAQWIAPSASVEEIDKRLQELRAVQFWLEQNARALTATIQALEVQKMTLKALQSMPGGLGEWAVPFKMPEATVKTPPAEPPAASADPAAATIDPLQWWGALTQQFQQIASQALQEPAAQQAMQAGMAGDSARSALHRAADLAPAPGPVAAKPAAKAAAAKKPVAAKKTVTAKKPAAAAKTARR